jgi:hypothetical protein
MADDLTVEQSTLANLLLDERPHALRTTALRPVILIFQPAHDAADCAPVAASTDRQI